MNAATYPDGFRRIFKPILLATVTTWLAFLLSSSPATETDEATLTKVGQEAPAFKVTTLDNQEFSLAGHRGKVVLVNFFATWCGPCMAEMPHLEKDLWQRYRDRGLVVIALGREHTNAELSKFQKQKQFTFPLAGDPKREVFAKYAKQSIPRNYLIDRQGRIVYQSIGYTEADFVQLTAAVEKELGKETK